MNKIFIKIIFSITTENYLSGNIFPEISIRMNFYEGIVTLLGKSHRRKQTFQTNWFVRCIYNKVKSIKSGFITIMTQFQLDCVRKYVSFTEVMYSKTLSLRT